jgi:hypothetical protein
MLVAPTLEGLNKSSALSRMGQNLHTQPLRSPGSLNPPHAFVNIVNGALITVPR